MRLILKVILAGVGWVWVAGLASAMMSHYIMSPFIDKVS